MKLTRIAALFVFVLLTFAMPSTQPDPAGSMDSGASTPAAAPGPANDAGLKVSRNPEPLATGGPTYSGGVTVDGSPLWKTAGNWTVQDGDDISYENITIEVNGNLTLESGGSLTLTNVTLEFNASPPGPLHLTVWSDAFLFLFNCTWDSGALDFQGGGGTVGEGYLLNVTATDLRGWGFPMTGAIMLLNDSLSLREFNHTLQGGDDIIVGVRAVGRVINASGTHHLDSTFEGWYVDQYLLQSFNVTDTGNHNRSLMFDFIPQLIAPAKITATEDVACYAQLILYDTDHLAGELAVETDNGHMTYIAANTSLSVLLPEGTGNITVNITVTDPKGESDTAQMDVEFVPVNDAPVILGLPDPWTVNVTEDVEKKVAVALHDDDDEASNLTVSTNSSRVTWEAGTSSLVLLYPEGSVSELVKVTVRDGKTSSKYVLDVNHIPVNDAPVISGVPLTVNVTEEVVVLIPFVVTDPDDSMDDLVLVIENDLHNSSATLQSNGTLRLLYDRTPNNLSVSMRVFDGGAWSGEVELELNFTSVNDAPVFTGHPGNILMVEDGAPASLNLHGLFHDEEDKTSLSFRLTDHNSSMYTHKIEGHQIIFTPRPDAFGTDRPRLKIIDSGGESDSLRFHVNVTAINDAPRLLFPRVEGEPRPGIVQDFMVSYSDPEGDEPEYVKVVINDGIKGVEHRMHTPGPTGGGDGADVAGFSEISYIYSSSLPLGSYSYHFIASDGRLVGQTPAQELNIVGRTTFNFTKEPADGSFNLSVEVCFEVPTGASMMIVANHDPDIWDVYTNHTIGALSYTWTGMTFIIEPDVGYHGDICGVKLDFDPSGAPDDSPFSQMDADSLVLFRADRLEGLSEDEFDSMFVDGTTTSFPGAIVGWTGTAGVWGAESVGTGPFYVFGVLGDRDGDGVLDMHDAFPDDPTEWEDTDGDDTGDNSDAFPLDPSEQFDSDNDGVGDNSDAFPEDPTEISDHDNDGIGDVADTDDDNDGVPDIKDADPFNSAIGAKDDEKEGADEDGGTDNGAVYMLIAAVMLVLILGTLWYMSSLHNKAAEVAKMAREEEDTGAGRRGRRRKGRRPVPKGKVKKVDGGGGDKGSEADDGTRGEGAKGAGDETEAGTGDEKEGETED